MPYFSGTATTLTTTGALTHLATVWYQRKGLDRLTATFRHAQCTEPDAIPLRSGKTVQFYRYSLPAANTTASSEGAVGAGTNPATTTVSATISEYSNFITLSTLLTETAIDPIVENSADYLGYQAGLSVDTIIRTEFHSTTTPEISTQGAAATATDLRRAAALLRAIDVRPRAGEAFVGIVHPYVLYDLQADNTAGGFIDVLKYADAGRLLSGGAQLMGEEGKVGGVRLVSTTNVKTTGSAPNVLYFLTVCGLGAVGAIDLSGSGPTRVVDPQKQAFKINVIKGGPDKVDPEGMIGAAVSYRYVFVAKILDATNYRYRVIKADASLV